jgi:hypothetical protein
MLNIHQQEIILNSEFINNKQSICIIACAGSGKTTTIINKVIYMIKNLNCCAKDFILTTFTKNASEDIINRIKQNLDETIIKDLTIGTLHSIALSEIIKNNYKIALDEPESIPEEYLIKYLELLSNNEYKTPYKYIFIDEYQDINQLQYEIIKKWYNNCLLLVVVGDDQQNIYTFRNTSIKYILNFCDDFNGSYKYLNTNYRCNKGIVDMTNSIISFNTEIIKKDIISFNEEINKPKIRFFQNEIKEKKYILDYIIKVKNNNPNLSIAILSRTNKILYKIENFLLLNNIQTQLLDNEIKKNNNVYLCTIHGSKGLEFDNVILINCIDGSFPIVGADIEEERRLFYVACTRAKKELLITSLWFNKYRPSRFIYEIYKNYNNLIDLNQFNWNDNKYDKLVYNRKNKILDLIINMKIETIIDIKKNILPSEKYFKFNIIKIHEQFNILDIVNNLDDNIFCSMLNLQIYRMILELIPNTNYIYLNFIKNDIVFKNNSFSLKQIINKYLENNDNNILNKHIEYFKKAKSDFDIPLNKKILINIYNILQESEIITIDYNNITKSNRLILLDSYKKFQNDNLRSIDIIDDIFNLSLTDELIKGRYSYQLLIDNIKYINKIILIEKLIYIFGWLKSNISLSDEIDYNYDIIINNNIIGKIDLILDNRIIIIESKNIIKPSINDFIKYLILWSKYNKDNNNKITIIQYYNPYNGNIYEWNMIEYINTYNSYKIIDYLIILLSK